MFNLKHHKLRKEVRELLKATRRLLRTNRDITDPRRTQEVAAACDQLAAALAIKDMPAINNRREILETHIEKTFPRPSHAGLRENVEVLLVALLVAMGVRTFFVQPFKIPTGSMQPTLYGIYPSPPLPPRSYETGAPNLFERVFRIVFQGQMFERWGYRTRGDHIFVDKLSYHFRKPNRGEVIVFETTNIPDIDDQSRGKFYIKRLIGLPGDTIQIQPPYVLVNGSILDERPAFQRIYSRQNGYSGYVTMEEYYPRPKYLPTATSVYQIPADQLFVMGDNSRHSKDSRYWGGLPKRDLVGRAFCVYWPFSRRFGLID